MKKKSKTVKKNQQKKQKVIYLLVEGQTEDNYFNFIKQLFDLRYKIKIQTKSGFKSVREELKSIKNIENLETEEIFFVYDTENSELNIKKFFKENGDKVIDNLFITSVSFEVYLLLHFEGNKISSNQLKSVETRIKELREFLPNYKKGSSYNFYKIISEQDVMNSIINEENIKDVHNSYSDIGELVLKLKNITK